MIKLDILCFFWLYLFFSRTTKEKTQKIKTIFLPTILFSKHRIMELTVQKKCKSQKLLSKQKNYKHTILSIRLFESPLFLDIFVEKKVND